jgi:hypothetical protein
MIHRAAIVRAGAVTLIVACGGLAEDGRPDAGDSAGAACAGGEPCADAERAGVERGRDVSEPPTANAASGTDTHVSGAGALADETAAERVGHPCEPGAIGSEGQIAIGEILLEENASCGARNLCLMQSPRADAARCSSGPEFAPPGACADTILSGEIVPVPPTLAPAAAPAGGVCTCRCAGAGENAAYCACPADMSCHELIVSSGVNGAAADYVGSYCMY